MAACMVLGKCMTFTRMMWGSTPIQAQCGKVVYGEMPESALNAATERGADRVGPKAMCSGSAPMPVRVLLVSIAVLHPALSIVCPAGQLARIVWALAFECG